MTISVTCEACRKVYNLKTEAAGQSFVCQACGGEVEVPDGDISEPVPVPVGGGGPVPAPLPYTPLPVPVNASRAAALARVKLPAIFMMVTAGISCFIQPILMATGGGTLLIFGDDIDVDPIFKVLSGTGGLVYLGLCMIASIIVLVGAWKMKNLRAYWFSVTAMLIGTFPCMSICGCVGFFIGIWGLAVLNNADVKAAFRSSGN